MQTFILTLKAQLTDGSEYHDFIRFMAESKTKAIELQTKYLESVVAKAQGGNPIWANNSARYTEWQSFTLS